MCLLVLSHDAHAQYRFVLAGNRDEFHTRPARTAHWWRDAPQILAGRDLEAGGTWLGLTRDGRFAVVTNYREAQPPSSAIDAPSRGALVSEFLRSDVTAEQFAAATRANGHRYRGYSVIVGDGSELWFVSNRDADPRRLESGVYGLSNHLLDEPWPKVVRAKTRFASVLARQVTSGALLEMLEDRTPARGAAATPSTGNKAADRGVRQAALMPKLDHDAARALSAIFVSTPHYGTRCSTAITITHDGDVEFAERSFDAEGKPVGEERFGFRIRTV